MKQRNISLIICFLSFFISCQQLVDKGKNETKVAEVDIQQKSVEETVMPEVTTRMKDSLDSLKELRRLKAIKASEECKIDFLIEIRNSVGHLTYQQILSFLGNFNDICELNIEYSEFNNYLLFSILRSQPELILKVISENKTLQYQYINKNLTSPINDTINLNGIYKNVDAVKGYEGVKDSVLTSLKIAIDSYN